MKNRNRGATLIELMTALAVLGVLVAIAVPSFRGFTAGSNATATTNDLVTALNFARSEALHRSSSMSVCASSNQTTCTGSTTWASGWIVYEDRNANGTLEVGEPLLRVWPPVANGVAITATNSSSTAVSRVTYDAMGMGALGGLSWVRFNVVPNGCLGTGAGRTEIRVAGTIRSSKVACP